jgi:hypothetical protein
MELGVDRFSVLSSRALLVEECLAPVDALTLVLNSHVRTNIIFVECILLRYL